MGKKKKQPNLSPEQEEKLIKNLLDTGFSQQGISSLFNGKYPQSKISNMKQKQDAYKQGQEDKEKEIHSKVFDKVVELKGKAAPMILGSLDD